MLEMIGELPVSMGWYPIEFQSSSENKYLHKLLLVLCNLFAIDHITPFLFC